MSPLKLVWKSPAETVIVTGAFDNWSQSVTAVKQEDGTFVAEIDVTDKIVFKFIVDGEWKTGDYEVETDENGNENNVFSIKLDKTEFPEPSAQIQASQESSATLTEDEPVQPSKKPVKKSIWKKLKKVFKA